MAEANPFLAAAPPTATDDAPPTAAPNPFLATRDRGTNPFLTAAPRAASAVPRETNPFLSARGKNPFLSAAEPTGDDTEKPSYWSEFVNPIKSTIHRGVHDVNALANRIERGIADTTGIGKESAAADTKALADADKLYEEPKSGAPGITSIRSVDDAARYALSITGNVTAALGQMVGMGIPRAAALSALEGFEETKAKTGSTGRALAEGTLEAGATAAPLHLMGQAFKGGAKPLIASAGGMAGIGLGSEAGRRELQGDKGLTGQEALDVAAEGGLMGLVPGAMGAAARKLPDIRETKLGKSVEQTFSPTTVAPESEAAAVIMRARTGALAADSVRARERLEQHRAAVGALPEPDLAVVKDGLNNGLTLDQIPGAERFAFQDRIERGEAHKLDKPLQPVAAELRKMLDDNRDKIQSLGKGYLDKFYEDYFPRQWKDPDAAKKAQQGVQQTGEQQAFAQAHSKSPLRPKGFMKQRSLATMADGLKLGLEPVTNNPLDMVLLKIREMDKFYHGELMMDELKDAGLVKFATSTRSAPPGWKPLEGQEFTVFAPPAVAEHFAAYDPRIRQGLQNLADYLKVDIKTPLTDPIMGKMGAYGYTGRKIPAVVARFGGDEAILMHEIGHKLDFHHRLSDYFGRDKVAWDELANLARARAPGATDPKYVAYLLEPAERIANLFHAYWHAPDLLKQQAPRAEAMLQKYLNGNPNLKRVVDTVKPSVQLTGETQRELFFGPRRMGAYYAPEPVQRVLKNYLSKGLAGSPIYDGIRQMGNSLNMAQLGASGFHLTFTSIDATTSTVAQAIDQIADGRPFDAAKSLAQAPLAWGTNMIQGSRMIRAYLDPDHATPPYRKLVKALTSGGGRIRMDELHQATPAGSFTRSWRNGTFTQEAREYLRQLPKSPIRTSLTIATRALETTMAPIMEYIVPRQKLGVFVGMASDYLAAHPAASDLEVAKAMQVAWDSVDNRMGQMVYDNVFWNKTLKDSAFLSVRSVGWNLGTLRELGGGVLDTARFANQRLTGGDAEWTHRMSYMVALPIVVGSLGASLNYFYTGEGPQDLTDYFFPRTGKMTPTGMPERVSFPSYGKDVVEFAHAPGQTVQNKLNPSLSLLAQAWNNRDFYGAQIHNPDDPAVQQVEQWASYIAQQAVPFSYRGMKREQKEGATTLESVGTFFGLNPAPGFITDPDRDALYARLREIPALKKRLRAEAKRAQE